MTTYDDFSRPTTDTTNVFLSDAGIHSDSAIDEADKRTETHPVTTAEITEFCAAIEASTTAYFAKHYTNLIAPKFYADPKGRKYIRIVCEQYGSSRHVHCFVERDTGLIWKAAGWKAPARNFPRGSIRGDTSYALRRC